MTATDSRPVVRSQVEPRIVERRRTVLEAQRRRRRRRWVALAAVLAVVAATVGLAWSPVLDVDRVVVEGVDVVAPDEVREASGVRSGDHLALVDLAAARDGIRSLPWVASASVTRSWPGTVRIRVVEEVPLLRVRRGDTEVVASGTGVVLPEVPDAEALPLLDVVGIDPGGVDRLPEQMEPMLALYARMPEPLRAVLSAGRLDDTGSMWFDLADGATVRFGPVEDVPAKLAAVQAFLEQVSLECLDVLDVSTSRVTASRVQGCAVPPPTEVDRTAAPAGTEASDDGADAPADDGATG